MSKKFTLSINFTAPSLDLSIDANELKELKAEILDFIREAQSILKEETQLKMSANEPQRLSNRQNTEGTIKPVRSSQEFEMTPEQKSQRRSIYGKEP